ncbi:MAG: hypothetical protein V4638_09135 [Bacteroidota bacterium]
MDSNFKLVEKENVKELHFPLKEVLRKEADQKLRRHDLDRAIALGSLEHLKVKIYFEDETGKKVVHTTIWAVTEDSIVLKQNVVIPITRIHKLEI